MLIYAHNKDRDQALKEIGECIKAVSKIPTDAVELVDAEKIVKYLNKLYELIEMETELVDVVIDEIEEDNYNA